MRNNVSFPYRDKCGVKLMAVAHVAREERAIEHSRQAEVDVLSSRALQVVDDSKKIANDVGWCDFLMSASHSAEDRRAVRLLRLARRWMA